MTEPGEPEAEITETPDIPEENLAEPDGEEDETDPFDLEEDPAGESAVREPKPGAAAAMVVIAVLALFLICAGARALFGRSKS